MGRSYIVEAGVEKYFSSLEASHTVCTTGLLIGQSTSQRDYVIFSTKTPHRGDKSSCGTLDNVDIDWVTEHAKQVSRMLLGGLSVVGVFLIASPEVSKEAANVLRKVVFAVDKYLCKSSLLECADEEVTDRVVLQICSKTRKVVCKTFDVRDPKCSAKPADWKYQSGVSSSWPTVTCSIGLNLRLAVSVRSQEDKNKSIKEGLRRWARRVTSGTCLFNGRFMAPDAELVSGGGKGRNSKPGQQKVQAQILLPPTEVTEEPNARVADQPSASVIIRGQVCCRAYLHGNKPRAGQAADAIKRDVVNTVACRVDMLFEDLAMNPREEDQELCLPLRVFAPVPDTGVWVCDYMFPDEGAAEVAERFQEMLDCSVAEETIACDLEVSPRVAPPTTSQESTVSQDEEVTSRSQAEPTQVTPKKQSGVEYVIGAVVAGAVALLAAATSLLYLGE